MENFVQFSMCRYPVEIDNQTPLQKLKTQNQTVEKLFRHSNRKKIIPEPQTRPTDNHTPSLLTNSAGRNNPLTPMKESLL